MMGSCGPICLHSSRLKMLNGQCVLRFDSILLRRCICWRRLSETTHWHFGSCLQAIVAYQTTDDHNRKWITWWRSILDVSNRFWWLWYLWIEFIDLWWPVYTFTTRRLASLNVKSRTDFWHKRFDPGGNRSLCQANWICAKIGCPKIGWLKTHIQPSTYNWYTTVLIRLLWSMAFRNPLTMPFHSIVRQKLSGQVDSGPSISQPEDDELRTWKSPACTSQHTQRDGNLVHSKHGCGMIGILGKRNIGKLIIWGNDVVAFQGGWNQGRLVWLWVIKSTSWVQIPTRCIEWSLQLQEIPAELCRRTLHATRWVEWAFFIICCVHPKLTSPWRLVHTVLANFGIFLDSSFVLPKSSCRMLKDCWRQLATAFKLGSRNW